MPHLAAFGGFFGHIDGGFAVEELGFLRGGEGGEKGVGQDRFYGFCLTGLGGCLFQADGVFLGEL